jgi:putative DNA primase/helicase
VTRSYGKWWTHKRAAVGSIGGSGTSTMWRQIYIRSGELPRITNEAEIALLELNAEIYQRGGMMVRPVISTLKASDDRNTRVWNLIPVTAPYLVENLTRAAQFFRWDSRAKNFVVTDAPKKIADTYLSRQGEWKLPVLTGVVNTPFLRADGSICEQPGYDEATGLLFKPGDETFPSIPQLPGKNDALEALKVIDQLITTFPFVTETDRSVMLGAMLTALDRRSMSTAPLHAFTAPVQGSGKSLLVDIAAALTTGQPAPVISQGRSEEELEKRLGAALIQGDAIISIDNCEYSLQSAFLCQVLTQQRLNIRVLGLSRNIEVPANAALFATGNNLVIAGDLIRRTLLCSIDPQCERPEQRRFANDPIAVIKANRGALVAAALTVLRAWHVSNDRVGVPSFGSFDEWSYRVREPLIWLRRPDPCDTVTKVRDTDLYRTMHATVLLQWKEQLGVANAFTVREIIEVAVNSADFHGALLAVSGEKNGHTVSNERLGRWPKKVEGKILDGLMLKQEGIVHGYPKWRLTSG